MRSGDGIGSGGLKWTVELRDPAKTYSPQNVSYQLAEGLVNERLFYKALVVVANKMRSDMGRKDEIGIQPEKLQIGCNALVELKNVFCQMRQSRDLQAGDLTPILNRFEDVVGACYGWNSTVLQNVRRDLQNQENKEDVTIVHPAILKIEDELYGLAISVLTGGLEQDERREIYSTIYNEKFGEAFSVLAHYPIQGLYNQSLGGNGFNMQPFTSDSFIASCKLVLKDINIIARRDPAGFEGSKASLCSGILKKLQRVSDSGILSEGALDDVLLEAAKLVAPDAPSQQSSSAGRGGYSAVVKHNKDDWAEAYMRGGHSDAIAVYHIRDSSLVESICGMAQNNLTLAGMRAIEQQFARNLDAGLVRDNVSIRNALSDLKKNIKARERNPRIGVSGRQLIESASVAENTGGLSRGKGSILKKLFGGEKLEKEGKGGSASGRGRK
jgi:hypothetical protein